MRILSRVWKKFHKNEGGQIAILVGVMMTGLIGFSALAIDVGSLVSDKRDLQNAADSMALAGAIDLPDASAAVNAARAWATKNGVEPGQIESISVLQQSLPSRPNPKITVTLKREHDYKLARVVGVNSTDVNVDAAAIKTSPGGSDGVVPWSVLQSEVNSVNPGDLATLKFDSKDAVNGNFGALAIDGTGASTYRDTIEHGADSIICSEAAVAQGCQETSPECDGAVCPTEPGNMTGPTRTGVDYRINNTSSSCDTFGEVFTSNGNGSYSINQQCNPFVSGSQPSLRVIIVPIIDQLCNGRCNVTIKGFALFFLEGYDNGKCQGNSCEIKGRFVKAEITTGAIRGVYDPNSLMHFILLVE
jgi:Flp pilus assembly protein TadG